MHPSGLPSWKHIWPSSKKRMPRFDDARILGVWISFVRSILGAFRSVHGMGLMTYEQDRGPAKSCCCSTSRYFAMGLRHPPRIGASAVLAPSCHRPGTLTRGFHRPATIDTNDPALPVLFSRRAQQARGHDPFRVPQTGTTTQEPDMASGKEPMVNSLITTARLRGNFSCDWILQLMQHNKNPSVVLLGFPHCSQYVESLTSFRHHRPSCPWAAPSSFSYLPYLFCTALGGGHLVLICHQSTHPTTR